MAHLNNKIEFQMNILLCARVDLKMVLWFDCSVCNTEVKGRSDRPFTIGRWNEHINSGSAHSKKLAEMNSVATIKEKQKKEVLKISGLTILP